MTGDGEGGPGVRVDEVREDPSAFREVYEPGHPHADQRGIVQYPNVSVTMEYIDAMVAARAYEANVAMMNVTKTMVRQAIRLFA